MAAARAALPAAFFITILVSLSYSARKKMSVFLSILTIFILSAGFCLGFYSGIERIEAYDPFLEIPDSLNKKSGLILTLGDADMVLLGENGDISGDSGFPRVISFAERPLLYQEVSLGPAYTKVSLPLEHKIPWFIESINIDFTLITREFNNRYGNGLLSFLVYTGAVFLLLASLRFLLDLSFWPLANLFIGILAFRLVLSLAIFLNAGYVNEFLVSFVNGRLPEFLINPFVFLTICAVIILYTFLAFLARRSRGNDD